MLARMMVMAVAAAGLLAAGCGCGTGSCTDTRKDKCGKCLEFYHTEDPCKDGRKCTPEEKANYTALGTACAAKWGMVPIDPKYKLPAAECPVEFTTKMEPCPPSCSEINGKEPALAQAGFLITAFDTPAGTRYVMIGTENQFDPAAKLDAVGKGISAVAQELKASQGEVAVYLTEYPLISTGDGERSRQLNDSEVELIRQSAAGMGKPLSELKFVRWK